jgi:HAD superfamily hydrolase (TIGR01509 family)
MLETKVTILDAMGVIYSVKDDVKDLLCPFIMEKRGIRDTDRIKALYISASLGDITASEFWKSVGLTPSLGDEYLQRHKLTDGLIEFLDVIKLKGIQVWCVSNDVSEWSRKLRTRFELEQYFHGFIISGDVGVRKPDNEIFKHLLQKIGIKAEDALFVDDNDYNLDAAAKLGFKTILFDNNSTTSRHSVHKSASSFKVLLQYLL